jgi:sialidase-1
VSYTILQADEAHPRHSEASAAQLRGGALLLVWSEFEGTHDNNGSRIAGIVSRDGGQTWGERRVLVGNGAGLNVMSPALRRLPDGALGMLYSHRQSTTSAARHFVRSEDDGQTWAAPLRLPQEEPYTTGCHDRLTVLDGGRLVAPLHCTPDWHQHHLCVRCAWSDDHGRSWRLSPALELPKVSDSGESGCIEPDVAQRADGSLLMAIRTAMGTVFRAESPDGGETWTGLRSMEVVNPVAPALLRRIPGTGDLLLVWNWHYDWREPLAGLRRPLACAVSSDGGASWPVGRRKVLEDDPGHTYAYPSCHFLGSGKDAVAFLTYHVSPAGERGAPFTHQRSLRTMHLPLGWTTA